MKCDAKSLILERSLAMPAGQILRNSLPPRAGPGITAMSPPARHDQPF